MNPNQTDGADDPNDYQAKQRAVIQQGWNDVNQLNNQQQVDQFSKQPAYTNEERKIFQQCGRDSSYRALPMALVSMLACSYGIKRGIIKSHTSPFFKTVGFGFLGYVLGKISYFQSGQCQEKFLRELPHSNIAFQIRQSKGLPQPELSDNVETTHSDHLAPETPSMYNPEPETSHEAMQSNTMTYEKLRENHRNMDRFRKVQTEETYPNLIKEPPPSPPSYSPSGDYPHPKEEPTKRVRTNQYGDEVYE